jgi:antitoxin HicB
MLRYPIKIVKVDDAHLVSFPDFPEAHTFGEDRDEAKARAVDALMTVMDAYISDRRPIPAPSKVRRDAAALPPVMELKVELYKAMRDEGINKAELGRRLQWHMPQVDRVLDVHHASRLEQMQMALRALGRTVEVSVRRL